MLEDHDKLIRVVHGVLGIRWFDYAVTGMEAHACPTPMHLRKAALQTAAAIMQEVVASALRHGPHGRGTVGMVQVHPNSRNVIPARVKFSIDLRNSTDALVDQMPQRCWPSRSARAGLPGCRCRSSSCRRTQRSSSIPTARPPLNEPRAGRATARCPLSRARGTLPSTWRAWRRRR